MNLCIDIGNTRIKLGYFNGNRVFRIKTKSDFSYHSIKKWILSGPSVKNIILSSVVKHPDSFIKFLKKKYALIILTHRTKMPLKIKYRSPQSLGKDRIACAAGARLFFPKKNVLAINAGTCITYNYITEQGYFTGGSISPGLRMRLTAMHHFTQKLPHIPFSARGGSASGGHDRRPRRMGRSTRECILSGAVNGLLSEIEGVSVMFKNDYPDGKIVFTGGDGMFLYKELYLSHSLKNSIFVRPDLVLEGMNRILEYNSVQL